MCRALNIILDVERTTSCVAMSTFILMIVLFAMGALGLGLAVGYNHCIVNERVKKIKANAYGGDVGKAMVGMFTKPKINTISTTIRITTEQSSSTTTPKWIITGPQPGGPWGREKMGKADSGAVTKMPRLLLALFCSKFEGLYYCWNTFERNRKLASISPGNFTASQEYLQIPTEYK